MSLSFQGDFISSVVHFATTFNALTLNDTELGLFSAVVLLTADRPGITDIKSIEHYQDKLIEALKVQVIINLSADPTVFNKKNKSFGECRWEGTMPLNRTCFRVSSSNSRSSGTWVRSTRRIWTGSGWTGPNWRCRRSLPRFLTFPNARKICSDWKGLSFK